MTDLPRGPTRRRFLGYVGSAAAGAAVTVPVTSAALADDGPAPSGPASPTTVSPFGRHQPGVTLPAQRFGELVALDLDAAVDRDALGRLMRLWTGDVVALTNGRPAPGDPAPELAAARTDLTVTVGLGPQAFDVPGLRDHRPPGLVPVPPMRHDDLAERWSGGDLLLLVGGQDGTSVAHAVRRLVSDAAPFARLRWRQTGFWNGTTPTAGRPPDATCSGRSTAAATRCPARRRSTRRCGSATAAGWTAAPTLVVRRIRLDLDTWDELTRGEQEAAIGRRLGDGAPLTGGRERDDVDLAAVTEGRPVVAPDAHVRLSHPSTNGGARIFRKGLNYTSDVQTQQGWRAESGLVFMSFQADIDSQFTPIQRRLDRGDALNTWTTAVGSATFAILPGFEEGGWLGEPLLG